MDRRTFLRRAGLVAGGAAAGAAGALGEGELHLRSDVSPAGHAVGRHRPADLTSTTITYRVETDQPLVALTFDDGPSERYTQRVLDILADKGVPATFNLIGRHVQSLPALARRAAAQHEIGNHTWSHPDLSLASAGVARAQLQRGSDAIAAAVGRRPAIYRPPYGYFSGASVMVAAGFGYPIVMWDFEFNQHGESARDNVERMVRSARPGSIILGHDGGTLNCEVVVEALPSLIDRLRDKGLGFATTSHLLSLAAPRPATSNPAGGAA